MNSDEALDQHFQSITPNERFFFSFFRQAFNTHLNLISDPIHRSNSYALFSRFYLSSSFSLCLSHISASSFLPSLFSSFHFSFLSFSFLFYSLHFFFLLSFSFILIACLSFFDSYFLFFLFCFFSNFFSFFAFFPL